MKIHYVMHAPFETIGVLENWAERKKIPLVPIRAYQGEKFPKAQEVECLVSMGGPQSLFEIDSFPYLHEEILLMKKLLKDKKPILGICLGGQLLSVAAGAKIEKSPHPEIGVYRIHLTEEGKQDPVIASLPDSMPVLHWHQDMMGMTEQAKVLAASEACPRQIVRYSDQAIGFQCHMEIDKKRLKELAKNCAEDANKKGPYIQPLREILSWRTTSMNHAIYHVMDHFFLPYKPKVKA